MLLTLDEPNMLDKKIFSYKIVLKFGLCRYLKNHATSSKLYNVETPELIAQSRALFHTTVFSYSSFRYPVI